MTLFGRPTFTRWLVVISIPPPTPTFTAPIEIKLSSETTRGDTALCVAPVS